MALFGIQPVRLAIDDVVERIGKTRHRAKCEHPGNHNGGIVKNEQMTAENQRRQQQQVLGPLMRAREA